MLGLCLFSIVSRPQSYRLPFFAFLDARLLKFLKSEYFYFFLFTFALFADLICVLSIFIKIILGIVILILSFFFLELIGLYRRLKFRTELFKDKSYVFLLEEVFYVIGLI